VQPLSGEQTDQTLSQRVEWIQTVANDYSSCLRTRAVSPKNENSPSQVKNSPNKVKSTWEWRLTVGSTPKRNVVMRLVLEQVALGERIRFPEVTVFLYRVS